MEEHLSKLRLVGGITFNILAFSAFYVLVLHKTVELDLITIIIIL